MAAGATARKVATSGPLNHTSCRGQRTPSCVRRGVDVEIPSAAADQCSAIVLTSMTNL